MTTKLLLNTLLSICLVFAYTKSCLANSVESGNTRWCNEDLADKAAMSLEEDLEIHKRWLHIDNYKTKDGTSAAGYYLREKVKSWYYNHTDDRIVYEDDEYEYDSGFEYDLDSSSDELNLKIKYNF